MKWELSKENASPVLRICLKQETKQTANTLFVRWSFSFQCGELMPDNIVNVTKPQVIIFLYKQGTNLYALLVRHNSTHLLMHLLISIILEAVAIFR